MQDPAFRADQRNQMYAPQVEPITRLVMGSSQGLGWVPRWPRCAAASLPGSQPNDIVTCGCLVPAAAPAVGAIGGPTGP